MNRIRNLVDDHAFSFGANAPSLASATLERPSESDVPYCLFAPQHYERNYAYPLIVWLHSPNDQERQVQRIMPLVSLRNYVAVGPRGTLPCGDGEYCWSQRPDHIEQAEERVVAAIAAARRRYNISSERIFLAGYGCGGTMAYRIALNSPRRFAGVISIGGRFPANLRPLARLHDVRRLNLLLTTGRQSTNYPEQQACEDLRLLHSAGMSINLRQYPCADEVTEDMLSDMDRWIMEQVAATSSCQQDEPSQQSRRQ